MRGCPEGMRLSGQAKLVGCRLACISLSLVTPRPHIVYDAPDVGLVDAHAKCQAGHHNRRVVTLEVPVGCRALSEGQLGMVPCKHNIPHTQTGNTQSTAGCRVTLWHFCVSTHL